jgi:hypothetical protein
MLIRRCAWHRLYNGYPMLYGVTAWRRRGFQYTDGMCRRCAVTALEEWGKDARAASPPRLMPADLRAPGGRTGIVVAAAILVGLVITALARRNSGAGVPVPALPRATGLDAGLDVFPAVGVGRRGRGARSMAAGASTGPPIAPALGAPRQSRGAPLQP